MTMATTMIFDNDDTALWETTKSQERSRILLAWNMGIPTSVVVAAFNGSFTPSVSFGSVEYTPSTSAGPGIYNTDHSSVDIVPWTSQELQHWIDKVPGTSSEQITGSLLYCKTPEQ
jgi:hypothetical protein